ncbi:MULTISPECIES: Gfo/Idh/MocA family protein [unclassified Paenibacillus]|uniref:Gfo/Idh/MocA family protein n=1 Tax=unclassified Paenibacillus TaxID=185978 RepID=UPI001C10E437|nr:MULTISPECIES: Gfo/Idh/MocA family oxidoreductase [unclassified Paenibacillus]MBU5445520.1 Gfo/Idh/MocA family oxidoreductase [Paenibacillus sp. MSJ-34]CAH0118906.1 Inositol 2-dehydrogenase/D-chiro-inositol 3-dehydrogenase [Paenibacillus sp. CECT 9249]
MSGRQIRIGLIGSGQIGKIHLEQYGQIADAEIVAVCDVHEETARNAAEQYHVPHIYTDYREMLKRDDIDAVDVCLHNHFHAPVTVEALRAGKHVYCEKPIAGTYADGEAMVAAAAETGKKLHIQLGTLYRNDTKAAKTLIDGGMLGRIYHVRSNGFRRRNRPFVDGYGTAAFTRKEVAGGGALLDMGVYHIAQLLYLIGLPEIVSMTGKMYQEMDMPEERRAESGFNVEELAAGFVRMAGNVTLDIIEAWSVHLGGFEGSAILGSKGGIRLPSGHPPDGKHPFSFHSTVCDLDLDSSIDLDMMDVRRHRLNADEDAYDSSQRHWVAALQGRVPLMPTAEAALKTMLVSEGLYLSDREGREVTAEEVKERSQPASVEI